MLNVVEIVLPVFLVIGLGYAIRRQGLVDDTFFSQVNLLVYYVCLPLLLVYKIATADFSTSFNVNLVIATSAGVACCFVTTYLYGHWRGFSAPVLGSFCQGSFRGNLAYIALAIIFNAYGDIGLKKAGLLLGFLVPVLNFFAIFALLLPKHRGISYLEIIKQILFNPLILASMAGVLWSFFQIPMPTLLDRSLSIGGSFSLTKFKGDMWMAALATSVKLLLLPLVTAGFMLMLNISGLDFAIGLLMAGAPTAISTYVMACHMGGDGDLAGTIVMMATGFSAVSYTLLLLCLNYGLS